MPTSGLSRSLSVKSNSKSASSNPLSPSDIKLFVTNLRLLDLDLRPDWPNITVQTFSAKNADQKQRMAAAEWGLFRLLELWDPVETSQKLQPFFPPLEPLQSRNLRAALYRSLDSLKKEGVLGREAVLRKTMLEECKGDKFYEVLALFSMRVLRKVLASRPEDKRKQAIAKKLATTTTLSAETQQSLLPLAIAHKAALINVLRKKDAKRQKYAELEGLLKAKADEINQRIRKCKQTPRTRKHVIPQKEGDAIKKQLKDNWIGNPQWLEVILHGDHVQAQDAFLNSSFNKVWHMVDQGHRLEDAVPEVGLLENLQSRVEEQQARLQKWQKFHEELKEELSPSLDPAKPSPPTKEFRFDDHVQLQLRTGVEKEEAKKQPLRPEYRDILSKMDDELSRIATIKDTHTSITQSRRQGSSFGTARSPARHRKLPSDSIPAIPATPPLSAKFPPVSGKLSQDTVLRFPPQYHEAAITTPIDSEATLIARPSTTRTGVPASPPRSALEPQIRPHPYANTSDTLPTYSSSPPAALHVSPPLPFPPPPSSHFPSEPPILEPPQPSALEALAAQIVSTIGDATPSPAKKVQPRLSLVERTRLSMAHNSTFNPIPESPELPSPPPPNPTTSNNPTLDSQQSLIERTRLSMASMSHKSYNSLAPNKEKRKSTARQSLYPVNQFDTPRNRKSFMAIEEAKSEEKTPKDDLFDGEVDYERVFKSRPRIATSPIWGTPQGDADNREQEEEECDEGVTGVDLGDVDEDEDGDVTQAWEDSPLRGAGRGRLFGR